MEQSAPSSQDAVASTSASTTPDSGSYGQPSQMRLPVPSSNVIGLPSLLPKTCERSTPDSLMSMCLPAGFPARISARLATVLDWLSAPAQDSGSSSLAPFAFFDLESSSWKTSQGSLLLGSESLPPTWPRSGTAHDGAASEHPTLALPTSESESSSLLPTPSAYESTPTEDFTEEVREQLAHPHKRLYLEGRKWHAQRTLSRMASALLPTPSASDATGAEKETREARQQARTGGPSLRDLPRLLPTPSSREAKGVSARNPNRSDNGRPRSDRERPLSDIEQLTGASTETQSRGGKNSHDPLPGQLTIEDV